MRSKGITFKQCHERATFQSCALPSCDGILDVSRSVGKSTHLGIFLQTEAKGSEGKSSYPKASSDEALTLSAPGICCDQPGTMF